MADALWVAARRRRGRTLSGLVLLLSFDLARPLSVGVLSSLGWRRGAEGMVAAWLAAQHFNERNASIVPRFAELGACDVQLNLTLIDIHGDPKEAIDKYVHGREAYGFELIAGAYRSATSRPMAMLSPYHGVLQLGLSSSSPEFADASLFPYFSRCQPADDLSSEVIIEHVRLHGWRRIGLLYADDAWGSAFAEVLQEESARAMLDIVTVRFHPDDDDSIVAAVETMRAGGAAGEPPRILIAVALFRDQAPLLDAAAAAGLAGPEFHWVLAHPFTIPNLAGASEGAKRALDGAAHVTATPGFAGDARVARLRSALGALSHADLEPELEGGWAGTSAEWASFQDLAARAHVAPFGYDAMAAIGLAACAWTGEERAGAPRRTADERNAHVRALAFEGASGPLEFSASGDRSRASAKYAINNWVYDEPSGELLERAEVLQWEGGQIRQTNAWQWASGASAPPSDGLGDGSGAGSGAGRSGQVARGAAGGAGQRTIVQHAPSAPAVDAAFLVGVSLGSAFSLVLLLFCAARLYLAYGRFVHLVRARAAWRAAEVEAALSDRRRLSFPLHMLPASTFLQSGQLRRFEDLRSAASHVVISRLEISDAFFSANRLIFVSHQWLGAAEPDPARVQYGVMARAVRHVAALNGWPLDIVHVWVDYSSVPQEHPGTQELAIDSLAQYASMAHAFLIVVPDAVHAETGERCGVQSYQRRMWTRAEQVVYLFAHGRDNMYIDDGVSSAPVLVDSEWLSHSAFVFEGECSCCERLHCFNGEDRHYCDRQMLVRPLIGLYGEALAAHLKAQDGGEGLARIRTVLGALGQGLGGSWRGSAGGGLESTHLRPGEFSGRHGHRRAYRLPIAASRAPSRRSTASSDHEGQRLARACAGMGFAGLTPTRRPTASSDHEGQRLGLACAGLTRRHSADPELTCRHTPDPEGQRFAAACAGLGSPRAAMPGAPPPAASCAESDAERGQSASWRHFRPGPEPEPIPTLDLSRGAGPPPGQAAAGASTPGGGAAAAPPAAKVQHFSVAESEADWEPPTPRSFGHSMSRRLGLAHVRDLPPPFLDIIEGRDPEAMARMFPPTLELRTRHGSETVELFGDLVSEMTSRQRAVHAEVHAGAHSPAAPHGQARVLGANGGKGGGGSELKRFRDMHLERARERLSSCSRPSTRNSGAGPAERESPRLSASGNQRAAVSPTIVQVSATAPSCEAVLGGGTRSSSRPAALIPPASPHAAAAQLGRSPSALLPRPPAPMALSMLAPSTGAGASRRVTPAVMTVASP